MRISDWSSDVCSSDLHLSVRVLAMTTITPKNAAEWRTWLQRHHAKETEVWVVYVKSKHGRSMTWSDAVDEAICFGWIDKIGRASCRERVGMDVYISVVSVSLKQKKT